MPTQICDKTGSKLISTAGGSLDARYYDSRDAFGNESIFSLLRSQTNVSSSSPAKLSQDKISLPDIGFTEEIILFGSVENQKRGISLSVTLTNPDGMVQNFGATLSNSGSYKSVFTINPNSLPGKYSIHLSYDDKPLETLSFFVTSENVPDWIKNNTRSWSSESISDEEFVDGLEHLVDIGILSAIPSEMSIFEPKIPDWVKNTAKWWTENQISDEDFVESIQYLIKKGIIRI
jgi:hypothetical protein